MPFSSLFFPQCPPTPTPPAPVSLATAILAAPLPLGLGTRFGGMADANGGPSESAESDLGPVALCSTILPGPSHKKKTTKKNTSEAIIFARVPVRMTSSTNCLSYAGSGALPVKGNGRQLSVSISAFREMAGTPSASFDLFMTAELASF